MMLIFVGIRRNAMRRTTSVFSNKFQCIFRFANSFWCASCGLRAPLYAFFVSWLPRYPCHSPATLFIIYESKLYDCRTSAAPSSSTNLPAEHTHNRIHTIFAPPTILFNPLAPSKLGLESRRSSKFQHPNFENI